MARMPGTWAPEGYKGADRKMFGECHAHIIMDGKNYKAAVSLHRNGPAEGPIRQHLEAWQQAGVTFVRDGGDALGVSARARELAPEYGIDYRTPVFAIHKKGHYGGIVGHAFEDRKEYRELVERAKREGADFIKIMISGIMEFDQFGVLNEEGLSGEEIREMIETAHHMGMKVCGISCITNMAAGILDQPLDHKEVQEVADMVSRKFETIVTDTVKAMYKSQKEKK